MYLIHLRAIIDADSSHTALVSSLLPAMPADEPLEMEAGHEKAKYVDA